MSFFMRNYHAVQAFLDLQLPEKAKHVFLTLDLRANKEGVCWPSLARLARDASSSRSAAASALARLVKENLIERISMAGRVTHYRIIDPQKFLARVQAQEASQKDTDQSNAWIGASPSDPSNIWTQNIYHFKGIEQQQRTSPPFPSGEAVVVVSDPTLRQDLNLPISASSESAAGALDRPPAKDQICAFPDLSPTGTPAEGSASIQDAALGKGKTPMQAPPTPPLAIVLLPGSLFAPYREQLESLAARHGMEKVLDYVDKLDWQYRQKKEPPGKPIALLNKLLREGIITPEGYKTPQEREAIRLEKARVSEAARAEEARQRQEAEARQRQRETLFKALPDEEKALLYKEAAKRMPEYLRTGVWLESQAMLLFFGEGLKDARQLVG